MPDLTKDNLRHVWTQYLHERTPATSLINDVGLCGYAYFVHSLNIYAARANPHHLWFFQWPYWIDYGRQRGKHVVREACVQTMLDNWKHVHISKDIIAFPRIVRKIEAACIKAIDARRTPFRNGESRVYVGATLVGIIERTSIGYLLVYLSAKTPSNVLCTRKRLLAVSLNYFIGKMR